ncbi:MAG: phosphate ABC transporter permease PstA [Xanthomonadaceae bacterium]|nr:phosphate ABC transporter permease PstA [Xanthomonadaceae bacterium]
MRNWFKTDAPWLWMNAGALSLSIIMVVGLLGLIAVRGFAHFWPAEIVTTTWTSPSGDRQAVLGEVTDKEVLTAAAAREAGITVAEGERFVSRYLFKQGNRDFGRDFTWYLESQLDSEWEKPREAIMLERREWGNFYGFALEIKEDGETVASGEQVWPELLSRLSAQYTPLEEAYDIQRQRLDDLRKEMDRHVLVASLADGRQVQLPLSMIVRATRPNAMSLAEKASYYTTRIIEFVTDYPREANTEGGIFPAIFGTVTMVLLMTVFVTPFGVLAALYLREYAKQGPILKIIRISVYNLAGVPSIVFGVFGVGFFVYFLGGNIDQIFFPEALPAPTFGTPALLWVSLTLALLTLPVVIVATEEGLARIPRSLREGSYALGATKAETLWKVVVPLATPAMMTGMILAVARAAGEVAPLMLVGVVKLAPSLPIDGYAPFVHLERKIMHLGFHIYDVGFQSPNVEAARPLVYATALMLVILILVLNLSAIAIRNHLREKYKSEAD